MIVVRQFGEEDEFVAAEERFEVFERPAVAIERGLFDAKHRAAALDFQQVKIQEVAAAIGSLKENYRIALTLFFIEGYDQEETAGNFFPHKKRFR